MNEWDQVARYKPVAPPHVQQTYAMALKRPYIACWINSQGVAVPLSHSHLRKNAEKRCRESMYDRSSPSENHPTRYYIWDSSFPRWEPGNLHCWTPIAELPRNQWVPNR